MSDESAYEIGKKRKAEQELLNMKISDLEQISKYEIVGLTNTVDVAMERFCSRYGYKSIQHVFQERELRQYLPQRFLQPSTKKPKSWSIEYASNEIKIELERSERKGVQLDSAQTKAFMEKQNEVRANALIEMHNDGRLGEVSNLLNAVQCKSLQSHLGEMITGKNNE